MIIDSSAIIAIVLREPDELRMLTAIITAPVRQIARQAHKRFGRGHHPAKLNYGDCFSYALARSTGEPLLFKGDDFSQTDVEPALRD